MSSNSHPTREGWLLQAVEAMRPWLKEVGAELPPVVHVSVGFPKGSARAIGQCFDPTNNTVESDDAPPHVFVCPTQSEPIRVLDILLHELIHAAIGCEHGHKGPFKEKALALGLQGKMTATYAEEETALWYRLETLSKELGPYPHIPLGKPKKRAAKRAGWTRLKSVNDGSYTIVISPKTLAEYGPPSDPWGDLMVPKEADE